MTPVPRRRAVWPVPRGRADVAARVAPGGVARLVSRQIERRDRGACMREPRDLSHASPFGVTEGYTEGGVGPFSRTQVTSSSGTEAEHKTPVAPSLCIPIDLVAQ